MEWERVFEDLYTKGYSIADGLIDKELVVELEKEAKKVFNLNLMHKASIGIGKEIKESIRGDSIYWLREDSEIQKRFLDLLRWYQRELNKRFFLGINSLEAHFARYPKGSFYKKHYDNFRGKNNRVITFLLYLNREWKKEDGGELIIYKEKPIVIEPIFARIVTFITEGTLHEVKKTNKERYSIAAWLRRDSLF